MALGDRPIKGETRTYLVNFGTNAQCRVEDATGKTFNEALKAISAPDSPVKAFRQFFRCVLVDPVGESVSDEEVGTIIDDVGGWEVLQAAWAWPETQQPTTEKAEALV